ncbi:MAG: FG-GAP-like repeat-containing protein, partial [Acidobacteriaceae bacterium]|nr:FG-GAP-like repeat-containing protein [Acidobacteriaceae bacterium]
AVSPGTVAFCDTSVHAVPACSGLAVVGSAQLTAAGTASFKFIPGGTGHVYQAIFRGTNTYATSSSATQPVTVLHQTTSAIVSSGSTGNYMLTGTVVGTGDFVNGLTGNVSFLDASNADYSLGAAPLGASTFAQSYQLAPGSPITVGTNPYAVVIGDFNGDGIPDLAIANQGNSNVSILLGNGDGTFTQAPGSPIATSSPTSIAVGNFNSDGILDLIVGSSILLGNGDGTFAPAMSTGAGGKSVVVGDFNEDGNLDLAIVNGVNSSVSILLGNGDGTFTAAPGSPVPVGAVAQSLAIGDFNGDGTPDLVVTTGSTIGTYILLGNGDGTFTQAPGSPLTIPPAYGFTLIVPVAVGDFNGDGKQDLAMAVSGTVGLIPNTVIIFLGNGDGTFTQAPGTPVPVGTTPQSIAVGDFNGDSIPDLAVASVSGMPSILLGDGTGVFTRVPGTPIAITSSYALAVGDLDGDGVDDLALTAAVAGNPLYIVLNKVTQTATAQLTGVSVPGSGTHLVNAAYDGDGNYAASTSSTISLIASTAATTLSLEAAPTASTYGQQVMLTATLTPATLGALTADGEAVDFFADGVLLGIGHLSSGIATINTTALTAGTRNLTAVFGGDSNFFPSSAALSFTVGQAAPVVTWPAPAAITYGTVLSGSQLNATANVAGVFNYVPNFGAVVSAGTQTLNVTFTPTDTVNYTQQTANVTLMVDKATPGVGIVPPITASSSPNPADYGAEILLTATAPSSATGQITFIEGTTTICTATLAAGTAQCSPTTPLAIGDYHIVAQYGGDSNYITATSFPILQVIVTPGTTPPPGGDFSVDITSNTTQTIHPGATASFTVSVGFVNGAFNSAVILSTTATPGQTGLPPGATVLFVPPSVTPGGATALSTLMIQTSLANAENKPFGITYAVLALIIFPWIGARRLRKRLFLPRTTLLALISLGALAGAAGCGSGEGYFGARPQSYTFTVTGTSGSLSHTAPQTVTLNLQ